MKIVRAILAALFFSAFAGEAVVAMGSDHDHHSSSSIERDGEPSSDHGDHALHACGACHHAVGGSFGTVSSPSALKSGRYRIFSDRVRSFTSDPPFQPPIEFSV